MVPGVVLVGRQLPQPVGDGLAGRLLHVLDLSHPPAVQRLHRTAPEGHGGHPQTRPVSHRRHGEDDQHAAAMRVL